MRRNHASPRASPPREGAWQARLLLAFSLALISGCAAAPRPASLPLPRSELAGLASWYGRPYHGRRTANGERYDMEAMTAAHRTLPFNTRVRVERQDNGRRVEVRINDRGPFVRGRVIDLSRAAARRLNMLGKGVAPVRLVPLRVPPTPAARWLVLVGGFRWKWQARWFASRMWRRARVLRGWDGSPWQFRVQLKGFHSRKRAWETAARLRRAGYRAFLVRDR